MDYELIKLLILVINTLATAGIWVFVRYSSRNKHMDEKLEKMEQAFKKEMAEKCQRISTLEKAVAAMPTRDEVVRIHERLDKVGEDTGQMMLMLGEISGQIKQISKERQ